MRAVSLVLLRHAVRWLSLLRRSVIDHAIPPEDVEAVQAECIEATGQIQDMRRAAITARKVGDMRFGDGGEVPRNELLFLPKYAKHLGGAHVTAVARAALDSHVRIAQLHVRHVPPNQEDTEPVMKLKWRLVHWFYRGMFSGF